jgi:(p)ppGpp synthase/HD superfamily hydrolase
MRTLLQPTEALERALRLAAVAHRDQVRKGTPVPYVEHPMAVALILDRAGFDEAVVVAGLLHDVVEDTDVTIEQILEQFGDRVATAVAACSEEKLDAQGQKRPWIDRKRDHLDQVASAGDDARAVVLADKLHNLVSIELDLRDGVPVWDKFSVGRDQVLWYQRTMLDACACEDARHRAIAAECRDVLSRIVDSGR